MNDSAGAVATLPPCCMAAWRIILVVGKPIAAKTKPGLEFAASGKASGDGSCNRIVGSYMLSGEK